MSAKKHKEIQIIVEKISTFLEKLAEEHEDFDIRYVNIDIEGHSDDEVEEKETVLQMTINDCATLAEKEAEEDRKESDCKEEVKKELEDEGNKNCNTVAANEEQTSGSTVMDAHATNEQMEISDGDENVPRVKPTLVYLNLSKNGQEIMNILKKKRGKKPILVVIEQDNGSRRVLIPSRK